MPQTTPIRLPAGAPAQRGTFPDLKQMPFRGLAGSDADALSERDTPLIAARVDCSLGAHRAQTAGALVDRALSLPPLE